VVESGVYEGFARRHETLSYSSTIGNHIWTTVDKVSIRGRIDKDRQLRLELRILATEKVFRKGILVI
jgi:hypothetical protein